MAFTKMGIVTGTIEFYGKVDNYNGDGKEYCLCISDPVFSDIDQEAIDKAYTDNKGKVKLPALYKRIKEGEAIDKAYFNSTYPIEKVSVADKKETIEVKYPELKGMKVKMILNKTYIGPVLLETAPEEFQPTGFNMDSFGGLDFD